MSSIDTRNRLQSWVSFLRAHAAITRQLNADLLNAHGLTLSDYEVLLRLSNAEHGMMRRVDLAQSVLLTASGITRLLDGLERAGRVDTPRRHRGVLYRPLLGRRARAARRPPLAPAADARPTRTLHPRGVVPP